MTRSYYPKRTCRGCKQGMIVVFLVMSALQNEQKRTAIRNTWGAPKDCMQVRFFVGLTNETDITRSIFKENEKHEDIITGNFVDTYRNLVYKHIFALYWASNHCKNVPYFVRVDDDVIVNIDLLYSQLKDRYWNTTKLLACKVIYEHAVARSGSKWAVTRKEYPGRVYPDYCSGAFIIYSADIVKILWRESFKVPPFWLEDVHVTGTLAKRIGLKHVDIKEWFLKYLKGLSERSTAKNGPRPFLFGPLDLSVEDFYNVWIAVQLRRILLAKDNQNLPKRLEKLPQGYKMFMLRSLLKLYGIKNV